jgi:DNA-binding IclR family transcriptional regulator
VVEAVIGVAALAVPIPTSGTKAAAAIGTCLTTARYTSERRPALLNALQRCACDIAAVWDHPAADG